MVWRTEIGGRFFEIEDCGEVAEERRNKFLVGDER